MMSSRVVELVAQLNTDCLVADSNKYRLSAIFSRAGLFFRTHNRTHRLTASPPLIIVSLVSLCSRRG